MNTERIVTSRFAMLVMENPLSSKMGNALEYAPHTNLNVHNGEKKEFQNK